jgi:hypothetical protein
MTPLFCSISRRFAIVGLAVVVPGGALLAQNAEGTRPKMALRAQPAVAVAPARVVLTADITGGSNDFQEYYCPTIEWEWGDETSSESTSDCDPYEEGKSAIKRRYTVQHIFRRQGSYKVYLHLKRNDKIVGSASTTIQIQPGAIPSYE